jgi:hypothetical protein
MRSIRKSAVTLRAFVVGFAVPLAAQPGPCKQVTEACTNAGFVEGGGSSGNGLQIHCVNPIMQGTAQPATATRPLPQIDPNLVAACKAQNPNFGQAKGASAAALGTLPAGASPIATLPSSPAQLPPGVAPLAHYPDVPLPKLVAPPDPGKGSLAVEMQTGPHKTPLGNASSAEDDAYQHLFEVIFAKGNQELEALKSCAAKHCIIFNMTITEMHSSGGESTPARVYTMINATPFEYGKAPCAAPNAKDYCWAVILHYDTITEKQASHSSH